MAEREHKRREYPVKERARAAEMTVDQAIERFSGQWVVMKLTVFDAQHQPSRGRVIYHSPSPKRASRSLAKLLTADEPSEMPYYLFAAQPRTRDGTMLARVFGSEMDEGDAGEWRWPR
jgi:hypothetical protein